MIRQREYREGRYLVWRDYKADGTTIKSPVDIDTLPPGRYSSKAGETAKEIWEKVNDH